MRAHEKTGAGPGRCSRLGVFLALSVIPWAGCGEDATGWLGEDAIITGKVQNWTRGGGAVINYLPDASSTVPGQAILGADGAFAATLPRAVRTAPWGQVIGSVAGCSQAKEGVNPPDLQLMKLTLFVIEPNDVVNFRLWQTTGAITDDPTGTTSVLYLYAATDGTIEGTNECPRLGSGVSDVSTFDLNLRKGWNSVLLTYRSLRSTTTPLLVDLRTARPPAAATWWTVKVD